MLQTKLSCMVTVLLGMAVGVSAQAQTPESVLPERLVPDSLVADSLVADSIAPPSSARDSHNSKFHRFHRPMSHGLESIPSLTQIRSGRAHMMDALLPSSWRQQLSLRSDQLMHIHRLSAQFYQQQGPRIERLHAFRRVGGSGHMEFYPELQQLLEVRRQYRQAALRILTPHQLQHLRRWLFAPYYHHHHPRWH